MSALGPLVMIRQRRSNLGKQQLSYNSINCASALAKARPILVLFNPILACPILSLVFEANPILILASTSISPIPAEREARTGWDR
jgi:hypothetical protein